MLISCRVVSTSTMNDIMNIQINENQYIKWIYAKLFVLLSYKNY
jgi:hypothetical protein